jgi:hypothetical protein
MSYLSLVATLTVMFCDPVRPPGLDSIVKSQQWGMCVMLCQACQETHRSDPRWTRYGMFPLYESRVEVIVTNAPSMSDACETHAPPVEKSIASLVLRLC